MESMGITEAFGGQFVIYFFRRQSLRAICLISVQPLVYKRILD